MIFKAQYFFNLLFLKYDKKINEVGTPIVIYRNYTLITVFYWI